MLIALALLLSGYANAQLPCGIPSESGWRLVDAPINAPALIGLLPKPNPDPEVLDFNRAYEDYPKHWLARTDGSLLLCRSNGSPFATAPRCNSDGWSFQKIEGVFVAKSEWESMCVE